MQIEPAAQVFAERYAAGQAQVVWTTLVADLETPVSAFLKIAGGRPMSFLLESVEGTVTIGTPVRPDPAVPAMLGLSRAVDRLSGVIDDLDRPLDKEASYGDAGAIQVPPSSNTTPEQFGAMVRRAKEYIFAGDIFQVVLSQRFEAPFALPPLALYRALRRVNPAPFLYYLDYGGFAVAGSSPEILVRVRDGTVTVRPIAGTRPRGATPHEDKALEEELLADPKERAEHLML